MDKIGSSVFKWLIQIKTRSGKKIKRFENHT